MRKKLKLIISIIIFCMMNSPFLVNAENGTQKPRKDKGEEMKELLKAMDHPMTFYGKVIDQNNYPVADAQVIVGTRSSTAEKTLILTTDKQGRFELENEIGNLVYVRKVEKKGYEFSYEKNLNRGFDYSAEKEIHRHKPDSANPVIFTMRKKEPASIVFKHDFSFGLNQKNKYEQAVDVVMGHWKDLEKMGKWDDDEKADLLVKAVLSEDKKSFSVSFKSLDKEGGILERDELLYMVPESGYEPVHKVQVPVNNIIKKHLYVKGRQGSMYARIDLELQAGSDSVGVKLITWANPKGLRNVDYYPDLEAEEVMRIHEEKKRKAIEREERKKLKQQK